ncbi:unnamed protein product, partial [Sphacelaria rigidula]
MAAPFYGSPQQGRKRSAAAAAARAPSAATDVPVASPRMSSRINDSTLLTPEPAGKRRSRRGGAQDSSHSDSVKGDRAGEPATEADDGSDTAGAGTVFTPGTSTAHLLLHLRSSWRNRAVSPSLAATPVAPPPPGRPKPTTPPLIDAAEDDDRGGAGSGGGDSNEMNDVKMCSPDDDSSDPVKHRPFACGAMDTARERSTRSSHAVVVPPASSLPHKKRHKTAATMAAASVGTAAR